MLKNNSGWGFILGLVINAFKFTGAINMIVAHILMALALSVSLGMIYVSDNVAQKRRNIILVIVLFILFDGFMMLMAKKDLRLEELAHFSGQHDIYPRFWFFSGSFTKFGSTETLESTIPIVIENPGDFPIYDIEVHITEVLEQAKWWSETLSQMRAGAEIPTDAAGNIIPPPFIETHFQLATLQPNSSIQKEIMAPLSKDKSDYIYYIAVSARNGKVKYKYHFVKIEETLSTPLQRLHFYRAYKILKMVRSESHGGGFINKLIEEYHDPKFPVSKDGTIDYGPPLLDYVESPQ